MRRSWAALTVGILSVVVLATTAALIHYVSEKRSGSGNQVYALFRDAMGLTPKSRVVAAGIRIGQIDDISLDPASNKAKVTMSLDPKIKLWESAWVFKKSASLLGEFYLEIDPGGPVKVVNGERREFKPIPNGGQIVNVYEGSQPSEVIDQVANVMPILKDILENVRTLTGGQVKEIAERINSLIATNSVTLDRLLTRVDDIAANVQDITRSERDDIKETIRNAREITEGIKQLVGTTQGTVGTTGEKLQSSLDKLQKSISSLEKTMGNTEKITETVAQGEGTIGRLVKDPTIAENVEQITSDAGEFVHNLTRLQTIVGLRSEYNWLAGTYKSYFQIQLAPRPDKFYLIELVDDPRGFRTQTVRNVDDSRSPQGTYSQNIVETSERLRVSFMLGKCIGLLCGRFGIKESTGGVGVDAHLLDDRLMLSADVFDTHSNQYPRFQARGFVAVYKRYLYLVGGVDDVFNYTKLRGGAGGFFDWFLGAHLQFNDEDLKSILLFGGGAAAGAAGR